MNRPRKLFITACVVLMCGSPSRLLAQTALAEVTGEVTDTTGAPMSGVNISLTNTGTGISASLASNDAGHFYARSLAPGVYALRAEHPGFKSHYATSIELSTGQVLRYDFPMEVGDMATKVEVSAQSGTVEIQKDSGDISSVLSAKIIKEMPSITRRTLELINLTPGVRMTDRGQTASLARPFFSIAGNPYVRSSMFFIDGSNLGSTRIWGDGGNMSTMNPPTEAVTEMRVITNNYSAEFGQGLGGVVIMTSKSGTNQITGQLYYYGQNDAFDAKSYFAVRKNPNHYHDFGGAIGGPVVRNRTFYFASIDREIWHQATPQVLTVPTLLQRQGDFSRTLNAQGSLIPIYDPSTSRQDPGSQRTIRDPFPGNVIPVARFDPVAARVLNNYVAEPNTSGLITGGSNFIANALSLNRTRWWQFYRVDHQLSSADKLYGRFTREDLDLPTHGAYGGTKGALSDPNEASYTNVALTTGFGWTRIISPSTLSELRFGYTNYGLDFRYLGGNPQVWGKDWAGQLGLKNLAKDTFPGFNFAGYDSIGGTVRQQRKSDTLPVYTLSETISHQRGRHTMRTGGEAIRSRGVYASREFPSGLANFTPLATALPGVSNAGNSEASFLLGWVNSSSVQDQPPVDMRNWFYGFFFQDDWRLTNSLTFNLGVRYEYETPRLDVNGVTNFFSFTKNNPVCNCPGVIEFGDKNRSIFDNQPHKFAPRLGFAWSPLGRQDLVVRGGYGIFYMGAVAGDPVWGGPGLGRGVNANWSADAQALSPAFILSAGFPLATGEPLSDGWGAVPIGQRPRVNPLLNYPQRPAGYSEQFNFGIQKQLGSTIVELGYLGNAAKRLPRAGGFKNYNEVRPENRGPGDAQVRRPFPQFGDVLGSGEPIGSSLYHAALVQVKHHFSRGLTFQTSYTFARQLDDLSYTRSDWARKADYGPSSLELRHRFVWSSAYDLPWGRGKKFLGSGPLANVIGGWILGNIVNLESGTPVNLSSVSNTCNCFNSGTQGVNLIGNPARTTSGFDPRKDTWFNTAAFAAPSPFTFGNAGPGLIRSPGLFNIDTTVTKRVQVRERAAFELRGEFFNTLNHPNLGSPNASFGSASFGRITSAQPGRRIQLGLKLFF